MSSVRRSRAPETPGLLGGSLSSPFYGTSTRNKPALGIAIEPVHVFAKQRRIGAADGSQGRLLLLLS